MLDDDAGDDDDEAHLLGDGCCCDAMAVATSGFSSCSLSMLFRKLSNEREGLRGFFLLFGEEFESDRGGDDGGFCETGKGENVSRFSPCSFPMLFRKLSSEREGRRGFFLLLGEEVKFD